MANKHQHLSQPNIYKERKRLYCLACHYADPTATILITVFQSSPCQKKKKILYDHYFLLGPFKSLVIYLSSKPGWGQDDGVIPLVELSGGDVIARSYVLCLHSHLYLCYHHFPSWRRFFASSCGASSYHPHSLIQPSK